MAKREGGRGHGDIQTLLAEQEASGLSVAAFARKHGLLSRQRRSGCRVN